MLEVFFRNCNNFENFLCKLWKITFPEGCVILRDTNSVSNFKLGFFIISWWFAVQNGQQVDILWYRVHRTNFSGIQDSDEVKHSVNALVSIIFHVTVKYNLQGSYCTFSKCSLGLIHCRVNLYSFSFAKFFEVSIKLPSLVDPNFLRVVSFL